MTQKQCPKCSAPYTPGAHVCEVNGVKLVEPVSSMGSAGSPYIDFMSIGKGLWGEVFKAKHATIDRQVAIKILHAHFGKRGADVRRVVEDAQTLSQVENENIAKVYEAGYINEHQPYIVTEFLKGQTLTAYLDSGSLIPEDVSLSIFKQCAMALMQAEQHKIVHGNLTPGNIVGDFTSANGNVKVTDFVPGNSFASELKEPRAETAKPSVTAYSYISPEQWAGKKLDVRSDIYSLGCVMYRIVLGHCPFEGTNGPDVRAQLSASQLGNIAHTSVCVSPALAAIIMRCLQKKTADRFQTAAELVIALDRAQMAPSQVPWGEPVRLPTIPKKALVVVAAVVVVGCAGYAIMNKVSNGLKPEARWAQAMSSSLREMRVGNLTGARRNIDDALSTVSAAASAANASALSSPSFISTFDYDLHLTRAYDAVLARLQVDSEREKMDDKDLALVETQPTLPGDTTPSGAIDLDTILASFSTTSDTTDRERMLELADKFNAECLRLGPLKTQRELLRAVAVFARVLGTHCNQYGDAQYELGLSFEEEFSSPQHTQNAIASFTAALDAYKTSYSPDVRRLCNGQEHLGIALGRLGDYSAAETQFREALKICLNDLGSDKQRSNLARLLAMTLRMENKIDDLNEFAFAELDRSLKSGSYNSAWAALSLDVDAAYDNHRLKPLKAYLEKRLEKFGANGRASVSRGLCLNALCRIALLNSQTADAKKYAEQACDSMQLGELPQSRMISGLALPQLLAVAVASGEPAKAIPAGEELVAISERSTIPPAFSSPFLANYLLAETCLLSKERLRANPQIQRVRQLLSSNSGVGVSGVMTKGFDANGRLILGEYGMGRLLLLAKQDSDAASAERFGLFRGTAALCLADYLRLLRLSTGDEQFDATTLGTLKRKAAVVAVDLAAILSKAKEMDPFKRAYCHAELTKYYEWIDDKDSCEKHLAASQKVLKLSPDRSFPDGITP